MGDAWRAPPCSQLRSSSLEKGPLLPCFCLWPGKKEPWPSTELLLILFQGLEASESRDPQSCCSKRCRPLRAIPGQASTHDRSPGSPRAVGPQALSCDPGENKCSLRQMCPGPTEKLALLSRGWYRPCSPTPDDHQGGAPRIQHDLPPQSAWWPCGSNGTIKHITWQLLLLPTATGMLRTGCALPDRAAAGGPRPQTETKPVGPGLGEKLPRLRAGALLSDGTPPLLLTFKLRGNKTVKLHCPVALATSQRPHSHTWLVGTRSDGSELRTSLSLQKVLLGRRCCQWERLGPGARSAVHCRVVGVMPL